MKEINKDITICLTSCERFDLLEKTIGSLIEFWDGPKPDGNNVAFLLNEDGGHPLPYAFSDVLNDFFVGNFKILYGNKDQIKGIDRMYSQVKTEYILHCEDDWEFYKTGFIGLSMDILEANPQIMQVWLREQNDRNGHGVVGVPLMTDNRTKYQFMSSEYMGKWSGFSFNPGLRRLTDYQRIFPEGYSGVTTFNLQDPWKSESDVGQAYKKAGMKAATLLNGFCRHIGGNGRHISK